MLRRADFYRRPSLRGAPIRKGRDGENADHSDCRRHSSSDGCSRLAADHAAQDPPSQEGPWQSAYCKQGASEEAQGQTRAEKHPIAEESPRAALGAPPSKPGFDMAEILPAAVKAKRHARRTLRRGHRQARNLALSSDDATRLREAIGASGSSKIPHVKALRAQIGNPIARKLIDWYLFRGGYGTASEIHAFIEANPAWPDQGLLRRRAEEALLVRRCQAGRDQGLLRRRRAAFPAAVWPRWRQPMPPSTTRHGPKPSPRRRWTDIDVPASIEPRPAQAHRPAVDRGGP